MHLACIAISDELARRLRIRGQCLSPRQPRPASAVLLVKDLCGVQAQDPVAATLAVRARTAGLAASDVEHARVRERSLVRTWGMRGTLHLFAADDLSWLLPLLAPVFNGRSRRRRAELGLDQETTTRAVHALQDILAGQGPLARAALVERLAGRGIRLEGQAAPHLLSYAALEAVVCCGPEHGGNATYVLLDDWIGTGRALPREAALAELARRYLAAYAPATPADLAAWSGLPSAEVRAAWASVADELLEMEVAGRPAWLPKAHAGWLDYPNADAPAVRLLPSFDTYLLGYRGRDLVVAPPFADGINPGGGLVHPTLLVDGRVLGTWRWNRRRDGAGLIVEPFEHLPTNVHPDLEAEAADLGRFLGIQATLHVQPPLSDAASCADVVNIARAGGNGNGA